MKKPRHTYRDTKKGVKMGLLKKLISYLLAFSTYV